MDQNTTNDSELSAGFLKQRRVLILISIILMLYIFEIVSITSIDVLDGVKIDTEQLSIKCILLALLGYFWVRYWQYSEACEHRKKLEKQKENQYQEVRMKFFKKIARAEIKKLLNLEIYYILETENALAPGYYFFSRWRRVEIYDVYKDGAYQNIGKLNQLKIDIIKQNGWKFLDKKKGHDITYYKVFKYSLGLEWILLGKKLKFYWHSAYFTDYLLPYYLAIVSLFVLIADYFSLSRINAVCYAIVLMFLKNIIANFLKNLLHKIKIL